MVNAFLTQPANLRVDTEVFIKDLLEEGQGLKGVGGFSLLCGNVGSRLAVVSNRTPAIDGVTWIAESRGETVGLSNTTIDDRSWYKVLRGEELMSAAIAKSVAHQDTKEFFIDEMMKLLSENTLPKRKQGQPLADYMLEFRKSIFIPALDGGNEDGVDRENNPMAEGHFKAVKGVPQKPAQHDGLSGAYGTQTQTVVLVDHGGRVTFVERRLYDSAANPIDEAERDKVFEYQIKADG